MRGTRSGKSCRLRCGARKSPFNTNASTGLRRGPLAALLGESPCSGDVWPLHDAARARTVLRPQVAQPAQPRCQQNILHRVGAGRHLPGKPGARVRGPQGQGPGAAGVAGRHVTLAGRRRRWPCPSRPPARARPPGRRPRPRGRVTCPPGWRARGGARRAARASRTLLHSETLSPGASRRAPRPVPPARRRPSSCPTIPTAGRRSRGCCSAAPTTRSKTTGTPP